MRTVSDTPAGPSRRMSPAPAFSRAALKSASAARLWVAGFFPDPATAADAALMTSELASPTRSSTARPSSRRAGDREGPGGDGVVRVDVTDQGRCTPCWPPVHGLGQGLAIVDALADATAPTDVPGGSRCAPAVRCDGTDQRLAALERQVAQIAASWPRSAPAWTALWPTAGRRVRRARGAADASRRNGPRSGVPGRGPAPGRGADWARRDASAGTAAEVTS
jgi:hypothetical protein